MYGKAMWEDVEEEGEGKKKVCIDNVWHADTRNYAVRLSSQIKQSNLLFYLLCNFMINEVVPFTEYW